MKCAEPECEFPASYRTIKLDLVVPLCLKHMYHAIEELGMEAESFVTMPSRFGNAGAEDE